MTGRITAEIAQDWLRPLARVMERAWASLLLITAALAVGLAFVVWDRGTPSAYAHFMYAPTILAAFRFRWVGGMLCGLLGGVLVGPGAAWIVTGVPVAESSWLVRAAWMGVVGFTLGALFDYARWQTGQLDRHLHMDPDTGLPNLPGMRRLMHRPTWSAGATESAPTLVATAIKVGNYDDLVGTFGHGGLAAVMRELSTRVRERLSGSDAVLGRTGSDELMLVETGPPGVDDENWAAGYRLSLDPTLSIGDMEVYVDTFRGVARASTADDSTNALFVRAAAAAAHARDHRVGLERYDSKQEARRLAGIQLLGQVPGALRNGQMRLVYQPKLNLHTRCFVGLEALIRWEHPRLGMVSPGRFIPMVEDTAMINELTLWVLRTAMQDSLRWRSIGSPTLAVNISTRNLTSGSLLGNVQALLDESGLPASSLELEITETALADIERSHLNLLSELQERGVRIAIDDFGSGYASLAYIRKLPVDILKLDRSFIRHAPSRPRDRMMLRRVVQIARDLNLEVVGEGVEDADTLDLLWSLGCDQIQGFHVARPQEASRVADMLRSGWDGAVALSRQRGNR